MTNLKENTARAALIALMATAPMAAFAAPHSGSPQQSVAEDPDENTGRAPAYGDSIEDTSKAGPYSYTPAEITDEVHGSIYKGDVKRDG
ncbi:hypothetical protein [Sulfitobacter sp.]|uniref:hypothetical protein n=1 Tax=Sulfitobacter sp. TaxID=1903071 RepID=UPI0030030E46